MALLLLVLAKTKTSHTLMGLTVLQRMLNLESLAAAVSFPRQTINIAYTDGTGCIAEDAQPWIFGCCCSLSEANTINIAYTDGTGCIAEDAQPWIFGGCCRSFAVATADISQ